MINIKPIFYVLGILLLILSLTMSVPLTIDLVDGNSDWVAFLLSMLFTGFVGLSLYLTNRQRVSQLEIRDAFLMTTLSWIVLVGFAAIPFTLSSVKLSFTDAYFESMSGFTTTGASIMSGLDMTGKGILMWRFISHWLGGIGIIVIALSILPMLRIGGMQLFKTESSDVSEKILPKVAQISSAITIFYLVATCVCVFALRFAGMTWFDAIGHAMSALATGGFSSHDASIGYFNSATIEMIITFFMLIGSVPFVLCVQLMRGRYRALFLDSQVRVLITIYAFSVTALTIWMVLHKDMSLLYALRYVSFNTASVLSGTGFSSADYSLWGPFAITYLFLLSVTGGCTGSTTGGIKIFRYQVFYETAKSQIQQLVRPHGIFTPHFNNRPISDNVTSSVMSFFIIFAFIFLIGSALMSLTGLDFLTSMSSTASFLANVGPGLGNIVGPAGNYASLTDSAKWLGSALMLVGRLELFTIMVLFTREFWRK